MSTLLSHTVYSVFGQIQEAPIALQIFLYTCIAIFSICVTWFITSRIFHRKRIIPQADQSTSIETDEGFIKLPELGFEFYISREALGTQRPLRQQLKSAQEVWALWITGEQHGYMETLKGKGNLERLILANPDPKRSSLEFYAKAFNMNNTKKITTDIRNTTKLAKEKGIDIKWFEGLTSYTMIIGNPLSSKGEGWAHVESIVAPVNPIGVDIRPSFRIAQRHHPEPFEILVKVYDDLWNNKSEHPSE